ncbi:universal stress protein UspA [Fructilactobacillus sanfranciscensis]|uniref:universal stress protein n=1 Tax=Fructilactobacillus sanfranciscensis TaxID=1625 RepID=UPI000CD42D25|nr:universal stress protein [Fructilactobacillus sanfranciscensis]POH11334.1 universal stress protein UspA [Fructilactobacillus sanfranciscensis]POH16601.1 universal stress protein UspA [Fructilactobacillus sanfranciscensis]
MTKVEPLIFKRILLNIDADDPQANEKALSCAVTQAKEFGAELGICSVLEGDDINIYDSLTPKKLDEKRAALNAVIFKYVDAAKDFGIENVSAIASEGGDIDDQILDDIIPDFKPDLLVCGADKDGEHHFYSISIKLAKRAKISVIVVR